jgi:hypothetical protein
MKNSSKKIPQSTQYNQQEIEPIQEPEATPIPEEFPLQESSNENEENKPIPEITPHKEGKKKSKTKNSINRS